MCIGNNNITRRLESRKSITIIRIGATTTILTLNQIIWFSHGQSTCTHYFFKYFKERRNCWIKSYIINSSHNLVSRWLARPFSSNDFRFLTHILFSFVFLNIFELKNKKIKCWMWITIDKITKWERHRRHTCITAMLLCTQHTAAIFSSVLFPGEHIVVVWYSFDGIRREKKKLYYTRMSHMWVYNFAVFFFSFWWGEILFFPLDYHKHISFFLTLIIY